MVSMQTYVEHVRQLSVKLITVVLILITAAIGLCDTVLAQAQDADVAVVFLVDESLSSAAIAGGEKETLYNAVRFLNGALAVACKPGQCQTGVSRFSAKPTQLVPLKSVEEWDDRDFLRLEIGVQDRVDQSDFPTAFEETCRQMHRSSDANTKVLVVLTDGQVGSQESPNIAPVQRARATNRATFVEEIRASVEFCRDNDVRLVTVLLDPSDMEGGQPGVNLDGEDNS